MRTDDKLKVTAEHIIKHSNDSSMGFAHAPVAFALAALKQAVDDAVAEERMATREVVIEARIHPGAQKRLLAALDARSSEWKRKP